MRKVLVAVSLLAASTSQTLVAQSRYLPSSPGTWQPWKFTAYPIPGACSARVLLRFHSDS